MLPASLVMWFSRNPYESFHFSSQTSEAEKCSKSVLSSLSFMSFAFSWSIVPSSKTFVVLRWTILIHAKRILLGYQGSLYNVPWWYDIVSTHPTILTILSKLSATFLLLLECLVLLFCWHENVQLTFYTFEMNTVLHCPLRLSPNSGSDFCALHMWTVETLNEPWL